MAYIYRRSAVGAEWKEVTEIISSTASLNDQFGYAVDISGSRVIVGSPSHNTGVKPWTGAASIFEEVDGVWKETSVLVANEAKASSTCGNKVALDGDRAFIGCWTDSKESQANNFAGSVIAIRPRIPGKKPSI
jgi:hypothetical protein